MQRRAARRRRIGRLAVPSSERSCEERKLLWRDRRGHVINNQRRHTQKQAQQKQRESGEAQLRPTEQYKQRSGSDNKRQAQQMAPDIKPGYASPQPVEQQARKGQVSSARADTTLPFAGLFGRERGERQPGSQKQKEAGKRKILWRPTGRHQLPQQDVWRTQRQDDQDDQSQRLRIKQTGQQIHP